MGQAKDVSAMRLPHTRQPKEYREGGMTLRSIASGARPAKPEEEEASAVGVLDTARARPSSPSVPKLTRSASCISIICCAPLCATAGVLTSVQDGSTLSARFRSISI